MLLQEFGRSCWGGGWGNYWRRTGHYETWRPTAVSGQSPTDVPRQPANLLTYLPPRARRNPSVALLHLVEPNSRIILAYAARGTGQGPRRGSDGCICLAAGRKWGGAEAWWDDQINHGGENQTIAPHDEPNHPFTVVAAHLTWDMSQELRHTNEITLAEGHSDFPRCMLLY